MCTKNMKKNPDKFELFFDSLGAGGILSLLCYFFQHPHGPVPKKGVFFPRWYMGVKIRVSLIPQIARSFGFHVRKYRNKFDFLPKISRLSNPDSQY